MNIIYVERRDLEKAYKIAEEINKFVDMIHSYFKNQFSQIIENLPEEKQKRYKEIEFKIYQVLSEIGDQVVRVRIITKPLIEEIEEAEELDEEKLENIKNSVQISAKKHINILKKNKKKF